MKKETALITQDEFDTRIMVLATIDELNQYLLGNVTLEAATDASRELTHKLNSFHDPLGQ
tara:strand:- start:1 stop:180 length:180 start_codon:yes stop_codon:yes gene_type:complete